ncbi:MAG TPA: YggT family protein [Anaerolineaceae bacterium]|nr:YggT family protein [Anaerolineaceae bacterium]HPN51166.1 YggT family protein [Anaerolineaceae bacterium]
MIIVIAQFISLISRLLTILIIVDVLLSYFLSPYHSVRVTLDRIVEPMLSPIRRLIPPAGGIDFSPIILVIAIQAIEMVLVNLLYSIV